MITKLPFTYNNIEEIDKILPRLFELTLQPSESDHSTMHIVLDNLYNFKNREKVLPLYKSSTVYYYLDENIIKGWSLLIQLKNNPTYNWMVYVETKYRRKGIGTKLLQAASSDVGGNLRVFPWSYGSDMFYDYNKSLYRCTRSYYTED